MYYVNRKTFLILGMLCICVGPVNAQEAITTKNDLGLSPELIQLLRAEMRELLGGIQSIPVGIATADWESVATTSARIRGSYILEQELTPAQKNELDTSLPEHFKRLDSHFHLEAAAVNHDAQLSAFHYHRLIETCTACHALYAPSRFPGFSEEKKHAHGE